MILQENIKYFVTIVTQTRFEMSKHLNIYLYINTER